MSSPLARCLFYYLRIVTLVFFCLWIVLIVFDRFLLNTPSPFISPPIRASHRTVSYASCIYVNDSTRCFPVSFTRETSSDENAKNLNKLADESEELTPNHLHSADLSLFWTPYFGANALTGKYASSWLSSTFGIGGDETVDDDQSLGIFFRPKYCYRQYPRCLITTHRRFVAYAKSIIFHWRDFSATDVPETRTREQLWILYNLESPQHTALLPTTTNPLFFNLTATYRLDSDLLIPYGSFVRSRQNKLKWKKSKSKPYRSNSTESANSSLPSTNVDLRFKTKSIAWFVSNCNTPSRREDYVRQLSRHIPIDIYGKCGKFTCDPPGSNECYRKVAKEYLFYLSFENSICTDYVTEKLFKIMQHDIVPIVYGGANYSAFMPPHSFIDATEIRPHDLARKLIAIGNDRRRYLRYFEWRKKFQLVNMDIPRNELLFCALCKRMSEPKSASERHKHEHDSNQKIAANQSKTTNEISSYSAERINSWYYDGTCDTKKIQFL